MDCDQRMGADAMRRLMILGVLVFSGLSADAKAGGWFRKRETVGGNNGPAMANVPHWAAERMSRYPAPLNVPQYGRRPWAYAVGPHGPLLPARRRRGPGPRRFQRLQRPVRPLLDLECGHPLIEFA
jgi:hypothetical protein